MGPGAGGRQGWVERGEVVEGGGGGSVYKKMSPV